MYTCICIWWNEQWNVEMNKEWWNEQWNDETLEECKIVKHTKWPSALTYDEMNIHIKWGE